MTDFLAGYVVPPGAGLADAPAGSFVFLPHGRAHRFSARDQSARLLLMYGIRVVPD